MDLREQATYSPLRRKESVTTRLQTDFKVPHTFIFWQVCFIWQLNQTSPKELFLAESEGCSVELTTTAQQNPDDIPHDSTPSSPGAEHGQTVPLDSNRSCNHAWSTLEGNST